jgi:hypothetical protein
MKKLLFFIALATFSFASAQITTNAGTFNKPSEGTKMLEFNFTPNLDGGSIYNLNGASINYRVFSSDTKAMRYTFGLSLSDSDELVETGFLDVNGDPILGEADLFYHFNAGLAWEHHFAGAERLSTFWGYGANAGYGSDEIVSVGAGLYSGFDYYVAPKLFIGGILGFALNVSSGDNTSWGIAPAMKGSLRFGYAF